MIQASKLKISSFQAIFVDFLPKRYGSFHTCLIFIQGALSKIISSFQILREKYKFSIYAWVQLQYIFKTLYMMI